VCHFVVSSGVIRRVKLYARLNDNGEFRRVPVVFGKTGRAVQPDGYVTTYLIRKAGKFISVGDDLDSAVIRLRQEQVAVGNGVVSGGDIRLQPMASLPGDPSGRVRIADAVEQYEQDLKTLQKAKYTTVMYTDVSQKFAKSYRKTYLDEIVRDDILHFMKWLRQNLKVRVQGAQSKTIVNYLTLLGIFLAKNGIKLVKPKGADANAPGLIFHDDRPKVLKKKPKKFDQDTIDKLLNVSDVDQKDYLLFLLWSGFRDQEVQFLEWQDFDWKNHTVTCHAKPHFDWRPKDHEERMISLPSPIIVRMQERMTRYPQGKLVFPNSVGKPNSHLLHRLHAVAEKAELNLVGQRAGHMFRKTAGSRVAKKLGLRAAMDFLGHSDVQTTALYLAADDMTSKKSREVFDEMYANNGD
jgi:integrase